METGPKYKRILLKISGEALAGEQKTGLDFGVIGRCAMSSRPAPNWACR